jgi:hypothetical protein
LSKINQLPTSLEQKVKDSEPTSLHGAEVARGYWILFSTEDCKLPIKTVGNCYGNNPTAPYILPVVPQWEDEFVDRKLHHVIAALQRNVSATYRFDEREALVVLGVLPPPGAYFGLQTYVYSREGTIRTADSIYQRVKLIPDVRDLLFTQTPNPSRVLVFASIGNSNNNVIIERQSGEAFNQERFFVITPDAVMEREMTSALLRAGVSDPKYVFTEHVSSELVRLGIGPEADDLLTVMRYALPAGGDANGATWRQQLPFAVLRVRDVNTARATEPYPTPAYDARSAISELGLGTDLGTLLGALKQQWGQPAAPAGSFINAFSYIDLVGQHCLGRPMNCLGDGQDTDTYRISPALGIEGGQVIAVLGTLATATGNATYVSLSVNRSAVLTGVANLSHLDLLGTAAALSGTVGNTGKFYIYYFARDCAGLANCLALPESIIPKGEAIKIIQRNYIFPGTTRGADARLLLSPLVVTFDGTNRPS